MENKLRIMLVTLKALMLKTHDAIVKKTRIISNA